MSEALVFAASYQTPQVFFLQNNQWAISVPVSRQSRTPLYLRTSPEFAAKKLLAAGEPRIFELARVWRNRERGPLHHPEFTMLEWYRAGEPYEALMADCAALLALAAEAVQAKALSFRGQKVDDPVTLVRAQVTSMLNESIAPGGDPRATLEICKAERDPASTRWT